MMWNGCYGMMGWGPGGWILGTLFVVIVAFVIIMVLRNRGGTAGVSGSETPLDILKKRYAKGEITKDDYERMKKDIQS